jgi:predicted  nucleic acid-binding Zn-ribbon protein
MATEIDEFTKLVEERKKFVEDNFRDKEPEAVKEEVKTEPEVVVEDATNQEEVKVDTVDNTEVTVDDRKLKEPVKIKDRGYEINIDNMDDLIALAHKGLNFENKSKQLKDAKKLSEYLTSNGIDVDDLQAVADLKKGNKAAILELSKKAGVEDIYDLDQEETYKPTSTRYTPISEVESVAQDIISDETFGNKVKNALSQLPEDFGRIISSDADLLKTFAYHDVKSGLADKVIPEALKMYSVNPNMYNGFGGAYVEATKKVLSQNGGRNTAVNEENKVNAELKKQKAAADRNSGEGDNKSSIDEIYKGNLSEDEVLALVKKQAARYKALG